MIFPIRWKWSTDVLADRTIGRAYGTVSRLSVVCRLSSVCLSVTFCIVTKRCILAKKCLKE